MLYHFWFFHLMQSHCIQASTKNTIGILTVTQNGLPLSYVAHKWSIVFIRMLTFLPLEQTVDHIFEIVNYFSGFGRTDHQSPTSVNFFFGFAKMVDIFAENGLLFSWKRIEVIDSLEETIDNHCKLTKTKSKKHV